MGGGAMGWLVLLLDPLTIILLQIGTDTAPQVPAPGEPQERPSLIQIVA